MKIELPCTIQHLTDSTTSCLILLIPQSSAEHFLMLLTALELQRIGQIECRVQTSSVVFSLDSAQTIRFKVPGTDLQGTLSAQQLEVLKCCIDGALGTYAEPHVDYELGSCDLTILFEGEDA